jgi:hypothetical protein
MALRAELSSSLGRRAVAGEILLRKPVRFSIGRCAFRVLEPYGVERRGRDARFHAFRRAPTIDAAAARLVRRGSGRALDYRRCALPSWSEAHRRLQQEGRPSKVRFPSDAQRRFEIPPPRILVSSFRPRP